MLILSTLSSLIYTVGKPHSYYNFSIKNILSYFTEITVHPQSVNTTLNTIVNFTCEANTLDIIFLVDGTLALFQDVINRGFTQQGVENLGNVKWRRVLLTKASEDNNNTNISCRASDSLSQKVYSDIAVLRIQGK